MIKVKRKFFPFLAAALALVVVLSLDHASAQRLFVTDSDLGNIYEFTSGGARSTYTSGLLHNPFGLAFDSSGNLFVVNNSPNGPGNIYEFATNGTQGTFATGLSNPPYGLAFDRLNNLFVADNSNIYEFTTNGTRSTFATGLNNPIGLAFDSSGNLFETDAGSGSVYKFTTNGTQSTVASGLNHPWDLAFDSVGELFCLSVRL
jgi:hypothetical protein